VPKTTEAELSRAMADNVEKLLEKTVDELQDLVERGIHDKVLQCLARCGDIGCRDGTQCVAGGGAVDRAEAATVRIAFGIDYANLAMPPIPSVLGRRGAAGSVERDAPATTRRACM
jgi:hypothetical protein